MGGEGGGGFTVLKLKSLQSAKICLNFNFLLKLKSQSAKIKCLKFQFSGRGYSETEKSKSNCAKICLNFNFRGGEYSETKVDNQCQDMPNFNFRGGVLGILKLKSESVLKISAFEIFIFGGGIVFCYCTIKVTFCTRNTFPASCKHF